MPVSVSAGCSLSTSNRRASFIAKEFPVAEPVEFVIDKQGKNVVYIPLLNMLQACFTLLRPGGSKESECRSFRDATCFSENALLAYDEFRIILYIDDFEVANPLGTSQLH